MDCFVEDEAHEAFVRALLRRLASDEDLPVELNVATARGGKPRVLSEFRAYQAAARSGFGTLGSPDLLVLVVDCDCTPRTDCAATLEDVLDPGVFAHHVVGLAASHVEAWYLADPDSFQLVVGVQPGQASDPCASNVHKRLLEETIRRGGHIVSNHGVEFAPDLVDAMDLYRAGKNDPSLNAFVSATRAELRRVHQELATQEP